MPTNPTSIQNNITPILHQELVRGLKKKGEDIQASLTPVDCDALHMAMALAGEAGEMVDAIKRGAIYGKGYDIINIIEEFGDLEFYMEGLRQAFNIDRIHTLSANIAKLKKRYPSATYTDADAIARADKSHEA